MPSMSSHSLKMFLQEHLFYLKMASINLSIAIQLLLSNLRNNVYWGKWVDQTLLTLPVVQNDGFSSVVGFLAMSFFSVSPTRDVLHIIIMIINHVNPLDQLIKISASSDNRPAMMCWGCFPTQNIFMSTDGTKYKRIESESDQQLYQSLFRWVRQQHLLAMTV